MSVLRHLPIFVYGTLKRGEERARSWPHAPRLIEWATIRGELRDLGPYPALLEGDDLILGELWHIAAEHLERTLAVLDEIECFGHEEVDLYVRRVVSACTLANEPREAWVYYLADPSQAARAATVLPDRDGFCHWSRQIPPRTAPRSSDLSTESEAR